MVADRLVIEAYDHNTVASDSHIGSLILSTKKLIAAGSQEGGFYSWCSLYGSPAENTGSEADAMNENPEIASVWKGMVLMHFAAEETDKPKKGMVTMEPEIKRRAEELGFFETEAYELIFEVGQGITLPGKDTDYKVRITVQENSWSTELPKEKRGRYVRWNSRSEILRWEFPKNPHSLFHKS